MIIKIENKEKNGYSYYEAEEIEYQHLTMKKAIDLNFDHVIWLINDDEKNKAELPVIHIWLYKDEASTIRLIHTTRETYIMNNNGKTIDRLL